MYLIIHVKVPELSVRYLYNFKLNHLLVIHQISLKVMTHLTMLR